MERQVIHLIEGVGCSVANGRPKNDNFDAIIKL